MSSPLHPPAAGTVVVVTAVVGGSVPPIPEGRPPPGAWLRTPGTLMVVVGLPPIAGLLLLPQDAITVPKTVTEAIVKMDTPLLCLSTSDLIFDRPLRVLEMSRSYPTRSGQNDTRRISTVELSPCLDIRPRPHQPRFQVRYRLKELRVSRRQSGTMDVRSEPSLDVRPSLSPWWLKTSVGFGERKGPRIAPGRCTWVEDCSRPRRPRFDRAGSISSILCNSGRRACDDMIESLPFKDC